MRTLPTHAVLVSIGFYVGAAVLLTVGLGDQPPYVFNWENYTAREFWSYVDGGTQWNDLFRFVDGVITDSGRSLLVTPLIWASFHLWGVSVAAMRLPLALVCATAVPLLWLAGRQVVGAGVAALGAGLLALSPVYLLYGRTATYVGLSMVFVVAALGVLLRVARPATPHRLSWQDFAWILGLQLLLIVGTYGYAPLRLLWLISLVVLAVELVVGQRGLTLVVALGITSLAVPLALMVAYSNEPNPVAAAQRYYAARGEQILKLQPDGYRNLLREPTSSTSRTELASRLIAQNAGDYANLLVDRGTRPTITDYWNFRGRLHSRLLVPFFVLGVALMAWRVRRTEARVLLLLSAGMAFPILLSSHVDVGRLAPTVPLLVLLTALGFVEALRRLLRGADAAMSRWIESRYRNLVLAAIGAAGVLAIVFVAARAAWVNYGEIRLGGTSQVIREGYLRQQLPVAERAGGFVLVASDAGVSRLDAAGYRLGLDDVYRFVDLSAPASVIRARADSRPAIVVGDLVHSAPQVVRSIGGCKYVFLVDPSNAEVFEGLAPELRRACGHPVRHAPLPA